MSHNHQGNPLTSDCPDDPKRNHLEPLPIAERTGLELNNPPSAEGVDQPHDDHARHGTPETAPHRAGRKIERHGLKRHNPSSEDSISIGNYLHAEQYTANRCT